MSKTKGNVSYCEACDTYFDKECFCEEESIEYGELQRDFIKILKNHYQMTWTDHRGEWELLLETKVGDQFIVSLEEL